VTKVSIVARGIAALGYTQQLPTEDRYLMTRSELFSRLCVLLGGRTAEEIVFGDVSTGAQNDLQRATEIARAMVTEYGMSALGPQQLGRSSGEVFLGKEMGHEPNYSEQVAADIDAEVRRLLDEAHEEAAEILLLHRVTLDHLADALVEHETLGDARLSAILGPLEQWESTATGQAAAKRPATDPADRRGADA
jgi:cell division protease FtsH